MKKTLKLLSNLIGFTGLWTALPIYFLAKQQILPVTTKHDKAYHGYGLRSIKNSVKKYNGVFQVKIKDGCFCLKILFPIKE